MSQDLDEKLERIRKYISPRIPKEFGVVDVQRLFNIGYNHSMHVIEHGVVNGIIEHINYGKYHFLEV